ncbi:MAG: M13 family peptidase [Deltaproteobacteria bacterium]|nr:MAG: M13 family peptidase [Deltaproteobacteria bacterium]
MLHRLCVLASALLLVACGASSARAPESSPAPAAEDPADDMAVGETTPAGPRFGTFGFDLAGMDRDVVPGDDFYRFANGTWERETEIPADRARYGVFDMLSLEAEEHVNRIILDASELGGEPGSNNQLIGDLYASWMDEEAIEESGLDPIRPLLERIAAAEDHDELAALMADIHLPSVYWTSISPDPADPTVYAVRMGQSGLGMPNREYYLDPAERFAEYREAYLEYIGRLHDLAGIEDDGSRARRILAFETAIAEDHWTRERSRQVSETYNVLDREALAELAPALDLLRTLELRGLGSAESVIVAQPSAIAAAGAHVAAADLDTLRDWMTFRTLSDRASWLPRAFDQARFDFFSRTLAGTEEMRPRDRRGTELVGFSLGHAVGQEYVARHFPPASRAMMEELVDNLIVGFRGRLETLPWMDEPTRAEALAKLSTFESRIGYPEIWDTYEGLVIDPEDHFGNRLRLAEHRWNDLVERFPHPVDRRRWSWPPQIVNASYHPLMNQITFPAGILQAPFFDPEADAAINYGAIGAVIGHEIGHGFDDQGRRFDAEGRIRDWWTEETNARFEEAAARLGAQYEEFCPIDDLCIIGRLTMGENIGDLGGMQMAYVAYRNHVAVTYPDGEAPVIDGFTGDQRFFLAWAQVWRTLFRDDALRQQLVNGPHSPGRYRVLGVVRNLDAWYDAFGVTEDHALFLPPEERVRIW